MRHNMQEVLGRETLSIQAGAVRLKEKEKGKWSQKPTERPVSIEDQKPDLPGHEIDADSPTHMHHPEEAKKQFEFLKMAAGGPGAGFVTKKNSSHELAKKLARSGHLEHVQEVAQLNGGKVHHWRLTGKGSAACAPRKMK